MASDEVEAVSLSATPKEDQLVKHEGRVYNTIREGLAFILIPPNTKVSQDAQSKPSAATVDDDQQRQSVFYNPIQQFNRDLSVLAIKAFGDDLCARRLAKYERNYEKLHQKKERRKDRKRKREVDAVGKVDIDKEVKSQRTEESEAQPGVNGKGQGEDNLEKHNDVDVSEERHQNGQPEDVDARNPVDNARDASGETNTTDDLFNDSVPTFRILDALSATGLRALRYAKEISSATSITAVDLDRKAVRSIEMHLKHNDLTSKIKPITANAIAHMYAVAHPTLDSHSPNHVSAKYDVIDLDPYGTAVPFLDAAIQALNDGGLLCVTCTDSGVFASCGYAEKTFALYGGMPAKGPHCHETGLRLVLHAIATTAAKYGIAIEPLLSLSIDFYVRLFVRVRRSAADVKFLAGKTMLVHECDIGCGAWSTQLLGRNTRREGKGDSVYWKHSIAQAPSADRHCEHCGTKTHVAGPMWAGPLHHPGFISKILKDVQSVDKAVYATTARIEGMLSTALDELLDTDYVPEHGSQDALIPKTAPEQLDQQPFFFIPSAIAKVLHTQSPSEAAIKGALRHAGHRVGRSHCKPGSVKTNASWTAVWEIMREWVKQKSPVKEERLRTGSAGWRIMGLDRRPEGIVPTETVTDAATEQQEKTTDVDEEQQKAEPAAVKTMKVVFDEALGRDKPGKKLVRYQVNPRENWGPMSRAR